MNTLFRLYLLFFLSILTTTKRVEAQVQAKEIKTVAGSQEGTSTRELDRYKKTLDSLTLEERYRNVIKLGELLIMDTDGQISELPVTYLINAYYQIGNKERSKEFLTQKIKKLNYKGLIDLLVSNDVALIKYFDVTRNKDLIMKAAINDYKNSERVTDQEAEEQIIRFLSMVSYSEG